MDFNVGDFAEQLLLEERSPKASVTALKPTVSTHSNVVGEQAPDISAVVVPDSFLNDIVESAVGSKKEEEEEVVLNEEGELVVQEDPIIKEGKEVVTESADDILLEIRDLLLGLKTRMDEMSTAGAMGMNVAGKETSKEDTSIEGKLKAILKKKRKSNK
jgi:hypothetical protein